MKLPTLLSILALTFSAVALATLLLQASDSESRPPASALPGTSGPDADLHTRVEALATENRALRERLALLENLPEPELRLPDLDGLVSREQLERFKEEVRAALASPGASALEAAADSTVFKERIANTLVELRKEESVAKVRALQEDRLARLDESMPKYEEWLELTPYQSDSMRSALQAHYEREAELVRRWQAGEDDEVLGEVKQSDRETHRLELSAILSPEQLQTYWSRVAGGGK